MGRIANQLLALNSAKHAIREAINEKGGSLEKWDPLSSYPAAIRNIPMPGGYEALAWCHVVFIEPDGTVLKDCFVKPGDPVTPPAIPNTPEKQHLIFVGWNRTDEELASVQHDMCVGALYKLDESNVQYAWVENVSTYSFYLVMYGIGSAKAAFDIDWGDGTVTRVDDVGTSYKGSGTHEYSEPYTGFIKIKNVNTAKGGLYQIKPFKRVYDSINYQRSNTVAKSQWYTAGGWYVLDATLPDNIIEQNEQNYFPADALGKVFSVMPVDYGNYDTISYNSAGLMRFSFGRAPANTGRNFKAKSASYGAIEIVEFRDGCYPDPGNYGKNYAHTALSLVLRQGGMGAYRLAGSFAAPTRRVFLPDFYGDCGYNYGGPAPFFAEGATIYSGTTATFQLAALPDEFVLWTFSRLGNATAAITLTLKGVSPRIQTALSDILVAKGYTVAYSN